MKKRKTLTVFIMLFFVSLGKSQITEKDLVRDPKTNSLYAVKNDNKTLVNEKVITVKLQNKDNPLNMGIKVIRSNILGYADLEVPKDVKVEDYVVRLKESKAFDGVYYNTYGEMDLYPNDPEFGIQNIEYLQYINMQDAWEYSTGSSSVKVAVLDTKVAYNHPDLGTGANGNLLLPSGWIYGSGYDYHKHGTEVVGVIGAKTNNSIGVTGVAGGFGSHGVTVIPYCVCSIGSDGDAHPDFAVVDDAIIAATIAGAKVVNMSFGNIIAQEGYYPPLDSAIEYAYDHGVVLVASSGNDGISSVNYPANHSKVIAVGSGSPVNGKHFFSNYGYGLDIVAPGLNIYSTTLGYSGGYSYNYNTGTSFSAPIVSGIAALLFSAKPNLTPNGIRDILRKTASKYSGYSYNNGWCSQIGYGVVNARAALSMALLSISGPSVASSSAVYSVNNLSQDFTVVWSLSDPYYNQNCLEQNTPSVNKCTITPDYNHDMVNATLTAAIKKDGVVVKTLTKTGMYAHEGFKGHYTSGNLSGDINYTHVFNVKPNNTTYITSPNFYGATVSYSSSGATPSIWAFSPTYGDLTFVTTNTSTPVVINVHDVCGNDYVLYAMPSNYSINISNGEGEITVTLNNEGDPERGLNLGQGWTVEVRNATTGELMVTCSSMSRSETISTAGWPKGIYIVKVTIGKEELTEKVLVN